MLSARIPLARDAGLVDGGCLVLGGRDLTEMPGRHLVVQGFRPDYDAMAAHGLDVAVAASGEWDTAIAVAARAKAVSRDRVARAAAHGRRVLVDGQKSDGIDSLLRACRARGRVGPVIAKAHGKIFAVEGGDFSDWLLEPAAGPDGFVVPPGGFSADGVDAGSALLARAFAGRLSGHVVDLGAGWGFLSARALDEEAVTRCDLIEADHASLEAARRNVADPRARFHWADATAAPAEGVAGADHVVCNPPFHHGRAADPELGRRFVTAAARHLSPRGRLWLVANRHLPYEATLTAAFGAVEDLPGSAAFKLTCASRPRRAPRR